MEKPKRKVGRPTTTAKPGKKATLGIRATANLKRRLVSEADRNDRSLSQEAELRLERSFERQDLAEEVLTVAYGRQLAGLLTALGRTMKDAGTMAGFQSTFTLEGSSDWLENPYAFDQAARAVTTIIEAFRPSGEVVEPKPQNIVVAGVRGTKVDPEESIARIHEELGELGEAFAATTLSAIAAPERAPTLELKEWGRKVHDMLGPLAEVKS